MEFRKQVCHELTKTQTAGLTYIKPLRLEIKHTIIYLCIFAPLGKQKANPALEFPPLPTESPTAFGGLLLSVCLLTWFSLALISTQPVCPCHEAEHMPSAHCHSVSCHATRLWTGRSRGREDRPAVGCSWTLPRAELPPPKLLL